MKCGIDKAILQDSTGVFSKIVYDLYSNKWLQKIKKTWISIMFHNKLYIEQDKKKKSRQFLEEGNLA